MNVRMFRLAIAATLLLTFFSCGMAPDNNTSEPIGTPQSMFASDTANIPSNIPSPEATINQKDDENGYMINISITIGDSVFSAILYDNDTARDFAARLPMTLNMSELNGNEKFYNLPDRLPTESKQIGSINTGDVMLYGSDCLVLFYESFTTSYSYTRLGYIEDTSSLAATLGNGSVEVTFEVSE